MCEKKGKPSTKKASPPLDENTLSPRAKALLEELSKEFKLSKEVVADLARMMYRLHKDQA